MAVSTVCECVRPYITRDATGDACCGRCAGDLVATPARPWRAQETRVKASTRVAPDAYRIRSANVWKVA